MLSIRRTAMFVLILLLPVMLLACTARLLQPVANQRPTPTPSTFASVTATNTTTTTGTDTITHAGTATMVRDATPTQTQVVTTPIVTVEETASPPSNITTQATITAMPPVVTMTATSTVMSLTSNAEAAAMLAQAQGYDNLSSPVDLIASYFNAVELADYPRAYAYWENPPLDYADFAAGYAETDSVQVIVQPPTRIEGAAGSLYAEVPTFLVAHHTDGSVHSFAGCMTTHKSNVPAPDAPDPDWYLYAAQFVAVDNFANIPAELASACAS